MLHNLAYYFSFGYRVPQDVDSYVEPLVEEMHRWERTHKLSDLFSVDVDGHLLIWDFRPASAAPLTVVRGLERLLYQACDSVCNPRKLGQIAEAHGYGTVSAEEVDERLGPLLSRGLIVVDGTRYLALALPIGEYSPSGPIVERFYQTARALGRSTKDGVILSLVELPAHRLPLPRSKARTNGRKPERRARTLTPSQFAFNASGQLVIQQRGHAK